MASPRTPGDYLEKTVSRRRQTLSTRGGLVTPTGKKIRDKRKGRPQAITQQPIGDFRENRQLPDPKSPGVQASVALSGLAHELGGQLGAEIFALAEGIRSRSLTETQVDKVVESILESQVFPDTKSRERFLRNVDRAKTLVVPTVTEEEGFDPDRTLDPGLEAGNKHTSERYDFNETLDSRRDPDVLDARPVVNVSGNEDADFLELGNEGEEEFFEELRSLFGQAKNLSDLKHINEFLGAKSSFTNKDPELQDLRIFIDNAVAYSSFIDHPHIRDGSELITVIEAEHGFQLTDKFDARNTCIRVLNTTYQDPTLIHELDELTTHTSSTDRFNRTVKSIIDPAVQKRLREGQRDEVERNSLLEIGNALELEEIISSLNREIVRLQSTSSNEVASDVAAKQLGKQRQYVQDIQSLLTTYAASPSLEIKGRIASLIQELSPKNGLAAAVSQIVREEYEKIAQNRVEVPSAVRQEEVPSALEGARIPPGVQQENYEAVKKFAEAIRDTQTLEDLIGVIQDGEYNGIAALLIDGPLNFVEVAQSLTELQNEQGPKKVEEILNKIPERFSLRFHAERLSKATQQTQVLETSEVQNTAEQPKNTSEGVQLGIPVAELFERALGVTATDLETVPGFSELNPAQQKLILENVREYKDAQPNSPVRKIWSALSRAVGRENAKTGMEQFGPLITQLTEGFSHHKLSVHEDEVGRLQPGFVDIKMDREKRREEKMVIDRLNSAAHALALLPESRKAEGRKAELGQEGKIMGFFKEKFSTSRKEYREYVEAEESYKKAKSAFIEQFRDRGDDELTRVILDVDFKTRMYQAVQTVPEIKTYTEAVADASWAKRIAKSMFTKENLGYGVFGAVSKAMLVGTLGVVAAPVISSAIAGTRAWRKTEAEQRERDREAVYGDPSKKDKSATALNVVPAVSMVEIGGVLRDRGMTQRLQDLLFEYNKNMFEPGDENKRDPVRILEQIKTRVEYMTDKRGLDRINFGTGPERIQNIARFEQTLMQARITLADATFTKTERTSKVLEELKRQLATKDIVRDLARDEQIANQVAKQALIGAGFTYFGGKAYEATKYLYDLVQDAETDAVRSVISEARDTIQQSGAREVPQTVTGSTAAPENISQPAAPETIPFESVQIPASYTVQPYDTLFEILQRTSPNHADIEALRALSPAQLQQVGVESGDINIIRETETINLERLRQLIDIQNAEVNPESPDAEVRGAGRPGRPYVAFDASDLNIGGDNTLNPERIEFTDSGVAQSLDDGKITFPDGTENVLEKQKAISVALMGGNVKSEVLQGVASVRVSEIETVLKSPQVPQDQKNLLERILQARTLLSGREYNVTPKPNEAVGAYLNRVTDVLGSNYNSKSLEELAKKIPRQSSKVLNV